MGLGYALSEHLVVENGQVLTQSFMDYAILKAEDMPRLGHPGPPGPRTGVMILTRPPAGAGSAACYAPDHHDVTVLPIRARGHCERGRRDTFDLMLRHGTEAGRRRESMSTDLKRKVITVLLSCLILSVVLSAASPPVAAALDVGDKASDFTLPSTTGEKISLSQFRAKKLVLLEFYGADFSPV